MQKIQYFQSESFENLLGNGYKNGIKDNAMLEYRLQPEDYWKKTLRTVYPYGLNERTRFIKIIPYENFSHHFQDMVKVLLTPEQDRK